MPSVRSSLSGPGLGPGWPPRYPTPTAAPRQCGWGSATGQPCDQPARRGVMVRGGRTEAADGSFPRRLFRGRDPSSEGRALASAITAEPRGTGRPVLDPGDGATSPDSECGHGSRRTIGLTQLQARKGGVLSCTLCPDATRSPPQPAQTRGNGGPVVVPSKGSIESSSGCMVRRPLPESGAGANGTRRAALMARRVVPTGWGGRWEKTLAVFCGHAGDSGEPRLRCQVRRIEDILCSQELERAAGVLANRKRARSVFLG